MSALNAEVLPRRICKDSVTDFAGEHAYWYCGGCGQWRTSEITSTGRIVCPVCESEPDWTKHEPTLAYQSRFKRVADLCGEGSTWRKDYDDAEQRFGQYIDDIHAGLLSRRSKESGRMYFQDIWKEVDKLADYILLAQDTPELPSPYAYSEDGLQRRYYDPRRAHNIATLSSLNFPSMTDDGGARLTDMEIAEIISFHNFQGEPFYDQYFEDGFLENITNPLERAIAIDLSRGATKRDIQRWYNLSEQQTRTKVRHIAKAIKN